MSKSKAISLPRQALLATVFMLAATILLAGQVLADSLQIKDLVKGTGDEATAGSTVHVHYTGWLLDGTKFDSSLDRGNPFSFPLGGGRVIKGWDIGVEGMKVGGKRELIIPADLAYGNRSAGSIPPGSTLKFHVELLKVAAAPFSNISPEELQQLKDANVKLIDIRRPDEWADTGIIDGSHKITAFDESGRFLPDFPQKFMALVDPGEKVALICRTGNRSSALAEVLATRAGYTEVHNLKDGIVRWIEEGRKVVK